jgi:hypothetical protein
MVLIDIHLLLISLEAIECICVQERSNAQSTKKASNKGKTGNKRPGTKYTVRVPKKACTKKHCNLCKEYGAYTMHNTKECCRYKKDGTENLISMPPKRRKEIQSHKAAFCSIEQDVGQA